MFSRLVEFECVAKKHAPTIERPDKLTIHEGKWAFCPFDALADGHDWRETGGTDVDTLLRKDRVALSAEALAGS